MFYTMLEYSTGNCWLFSRIRISFALEEMFFIPITGTSSALEDTRFDLILDLREGIYIYIYMCVCMCVC